MRRLFGNHLDRAVVCYRLSRKALGLQCAPRVRYVVPTVNWSNDWDGRYITRGVSQQFGLDAQVSEHARDAVGDIVHYGSLWSFLGSVGKPHNTRNSVVVTVFHGTRSPQYPELLEGMDRLIEHSDEARVVVTSCSIMSRRLIDWGIPQEKIRCIPLGVDHSIFKPPSPEERQARRRELGIPDGTICIGSFQKDGEGWEKGSTPKLIKGPDVFLETINGLRSSFPIFVLLTGPARGYVRQGLERMGVPYRHDMIDDYPKIPEWYKCLDLYVVSSREEGGPKAVVESLACGVPLVTTEVGMAPDVIRHRVNGLLADIDDVDGLVRCATTLLEDHTLREKVIRNGIADMRDYSWDHIVKQYFTKVYEPLLADLGV
jgi:glycosyltransferase involved in cell wall biosynthesis